MPGHALDGPWIRALRGRRPSLSGAPPPPREKSLLDPKACRVRRPGWEGTAQIPLSRMGLGTRRDAGLQSVLGIPDSSHLSSAILGGLARCPIRHLTALRCRDNAVGVVLSASPPTHLASGLRSVACPLLREHDYAL
jgi:hypothetical protein